MFDTFSMFTSAYSQADPFGKGIFLALFFLSIVSLFFIIHKIYLLSQVSRYSSIFQEAIERQKQSILGLNLDHLPKIPLREIPHPFAYIYLTLKNKTVEILDKNNLSTNHTDNYLSSTDVELVESHLHVMINRQKDLLEKNLFILSTTVTLAPFLGLLGTVWGILVTFSELKMGGSVSSNSAILGGLSTALTTTVLGLLIAIPALLAHNYLKNSSKSFFGKMHDFSHTLLSTIELQYRKVNL